MYDFKKKLMSQYQWKSIYFFYGKAEHITILVILRKIRNMNDALSLNPNQVAKEASKEFVHFA